MNFDGLSTVQITCIIFTLLIYGLSCGGPKFRAIILLCLPFMFTNRGRAIFIINCYELTTTYIAPNIQNNIHSLHYFYDCNKKVLTSHTVNEASNTEFYQNIKKSAKEFKQAGRKVLKYLSNLKRNTKKQLKTIYETKIKFLEELLLSCTQFGENASKNCGSGVQKTFNGVYFSDTIINELNSSLCSEFRTGDLCNSIEEKIKVQKNKSVQEWEKFVNETVS